MDLNISSGKIVINGKEYSGRKVSISGNGAVIVDGVTQDGAALVGPINVIVNGNADHINNTNGDILIHGNAGSVQTVSGDVKCRDISGSVRTVSGDVMAQSIAGQVNTVSGDIRK